MKLKPVFSFLNKKWIKRFLGHLGGLFTFLMIVWYINCLPDVLFNDSTSTVLLDKDQQLLGAKIAADGQWRFNAGHTSAPKFETCLLEFEDRDFHSHFGISIKGIGRAISQNVKHKKVVSGGSTITMQLARMMRKNPPRTIPEKIVEMVLATRMEIKYSKKEILNAYIAHAPFGNNVVGLEAASWRYFGRSADKLSWAESATLAVLPNAPGLIYPGKNHHKLVNKRNRLLKRLLTTKKIDPVTYQLALIEPLPDKPLPLPQIAPHLLSRLLKEKQGGQTITSTIDKHLQEKATQVLASHHEFLKENKIFNGCILITSVKTGKVLAYVGNTKSLQPEHGCEVDCINAPRSTGSILKPFLFAKSLEDGLITPFTLLPDIPSQFGNFSPKNFSLQYDGAVPAGKALSRSLNIPMVRLLNEYGLEKFYSELKHAGISTLNRPASHYGLSLILGGAEAKLWDLSLAYTHMAQELKDGKTVPITFIKNQRYTTPSNRIKKKRMEKHALKSTTKTNRACIYSTFEAMVDVNRPDEDGNWRAFNSAQKIAWKTGTSFGFRDAWAIGVTPDFVVAVWIGNADGEGRPGLTGIKAAAPVLFDVINLLPKPRGWFSAPKEDMCRIELCHESGHRASGICEQKDWIWIPKTCLNSIACPYHQIIHLNKNGKQRVDSECESMAEMTHTTWFVLPPFIEKYYKFNHPNYHELPDFKPECLAKVSDRPMTLVYPKATSKIYVPVEIDGTIGKTVFEAAHRNSATKIYWHLDEQYIGETKEIHQLALNPALGNHTLTLVDENGISISVKFKAIGK